MKRPKDNELRRTIALELDGYLAEEKPSRWTDFLHRMEIKHGAGQIMLERMLIIRHFRVENDQVISNE